MDNSSKFNYGLDVEVYIDKAIELLKDKFHYHWAKKELLNNQIRYAIELMDGQYHYVRYVTFDKDDIDTEVMDVEAWSPYKNVENGDDFIDRIVGDNEVGMFLVNKKVANYKVPFERGLEVDGWYIERYEFNRLETGDYSAFVQAGDRFSGGSRDFFIPPEYLQGTYEEFLDKYADLVPGESFGLYKDDLLKEEGLKKFLGFTD